jgi:hypothetical protein
MCRIRVAVAARFVLVALLLPQVVWRMVLQVVLPLVNVVLCVVRCIAVGESVAVIVAVVDLAVGVYFCRCRCRWCCYLLMGTETEIFAGYPQFLGHYGAAIAIITGDSLIVDEE